MFDLCSAPTVCQALCWTWQEMHWWVRPLTYVEMKEGGHLSCGRRRPLRAHPLSGPTEFIPSFVMLFIYGWGGGTRRENIWNIYIRDSAALKPSLTYIFWCWPDSYVKLITCQTLTGHLGFNVHCWWHKWRETLAYTLSSFSVHRKRHFQRIILAKLGLYVARQESVCKPNWRSQSLPRITWVSHFKPWLQVCGFFF